MTLNLPDGTEPSEIVLPDGSTASEVIAPDGSVVWSAIPDTAVARYEFEQDVTDSWYGNDLSDNTSAGYVSGTVGDFAKDFDGGNDYLSLPQSTVPSDFALSVWVDLDAVADGTNCTIFSTESTATVDSFSFYSTTTFGGANNQIRVVGGGAEIIVGPDIRGAGWTHLVFQNSGTTNELYVNGTLDSTASQSLDIGPTQFFGTFLDSGRYHQGALDDIRVYNEPLSSSEVSDLYSDGAGTTDGGINITEQSTSQVTSKLGWQGRPVMTELSNGDYVMVYRGGDDHSYTDGSAVIHIRFSNDQGATWTADDTTLSGAAVSGFPYSPTENPANNIVLEAPNGDLLIHVFENGDTTRFGTHQLRSTDGGASWTDEGIVSWANYSGQDEELCSGQDWFIHPDTGDIYVGLFIDDQLDKSKPLESGIGRSTDNGSTWEFLSVISSGTNEIGIEYTGGDGIVAIMRDDDGATTYRSTSSDLGSTWAAKEEITGDFKGHVNKPILHYDGKLRGNTYTDGVLWMVGRDRATDENTMIAWSDDVGQSWTIHYFAENVTDGGYSDLLHRSGDEYYYSSYEGTKTESDVYDWVFTT